jgi:hypothetical protein
MAFAAMAGPIISGIASMAGAAASASAMNAQADGEEKVAKWNADRMREEAAWAQGKGAVDARMREKEGSKQAAKARATMAQGGSAIDTGTPLLLEQEFASETAYRSNVEMANAIKQQRTLENKAAGIEYEGKIKADASRASGRAALLGGFAGAVKGIGGAFASGGGGGGSSSFSFG